MEMSWITFWSLSMLYFMQLYASLQVTGFSPPVWKSSRLWGATVSLVYLQIFVRSSPSVPATALKRNRRSHIRPDAPCVSTEAGKAAFSRYVANEASSTLLDVSCRTPTCVLSSRDTLTTSDINTFWFLSFCRAFAHWRAPTFYDVQWIFFLQRRNWKREPAPNELIKVFDSNQCGSNKVNTWNWSDQTNAAS